MNIRKVYTAICLGLACSASAQLVVNNTQTPSQLVQNVLLGPGVTVNNIMFNGGAGTIWSEQMGDFNSSMANVGITNGVILATGDVNAALGPNNDGSFQLGGGVISSPATCDADLQLLDPNATGFNDCASLEFDFTPTGDSIKFNFVFASEEYLEFVNSINDAFGFFISGPGFAGPYANGAENIALVPGTTTPITINTVNDVVNPAYYVDNGDGFTAPFSVDPFYVQYDGLTTVIAAEAAVQCGQSYHIKIVVADANDDAWDSAVFLQAGSFTSTGQVQASLAGGINLVNDTIMLEGCGTVDLSFTRLGDTSATDTLDLVVGGTATPGVDYLPALPTQLIYQPGDTIITVSLTIPLDADAQETIDIQINQLIQCAGANIQTNYTFYIQGPPPLTSATNNVASSCGATQMIGVQASGGYGIYSYLWDTAQVTDSISVSPNVTTTYYVTVSDTCGITSIMDSVVVTLPVYPQITFDLTPDTSIACLQNVNLQVTNVVGGNGVYTYDWTDGMASLGATNMITVAASSPQYFYVTVSEGCGNSVTDSVLVTQQVLPPVQVYASDVTAICPGDMVQLSIDSITGGNGVYTYSWGQAGITLATTTTLDVPVISTQSYIITVEDQCGTTGSAGVAAILPIYDPLVIDLTPHHLICLGDSSELFAQVSGGSGIYTIDWGTIIWYDTLNWSDPIVMVTPIDDTWYPVMVTDQCGTSQADSVIVYVEDVVTDIVVTQPGQDDVTLFASSVPPGEFFLWDMDDGTAMRGPEVSHSYLDLEDHEVTLIVRTENGCWDTTRVFIPAPGHVYLPNAFTPDGDTFNDFFGPVGNNITEFEMFIFDRWGQQIYHTEDGTPWDGKINGGNIAKQDVYVYHFRAVGHELPAFERTGHVTLIK